MATRHRRNRSGLILHVRSEGEDLFEVDLNLSFAGMDGMVKTPAERAHVAVMQR
jgi:hypothetical protein